MKLDNLITNLLENCQCNLPCLSELIESEESEGTYVQNGKDVGTERAQS
jgi:hypothetical protein